MNDSNEEISEKQVEIEGLESSNMVDGVDIANNVTNPVSSRITDTQPVKSSQNSTVGTTGNRENLENDIDDKTNTKLKEGINNSTNETGKPKEETNDNTDKTKISEEIKTNDSTGEIDKLDDKFCETFARMKVDGVEFTLNDSEKLFESNFLVDFAVYFQEKSLKPPIINALQKVVNALGSILHICVEILVYSVLSDEEFIEMIDFNKIRAKAIENSIYKYIIKHKEDKNLLIMASPYQEAIFTTKHDLYDMQVPLCKDKIVEEEEIDLKTLKFDPPTSGGAFGVLKKKLMDFFEEGLSIALESSFNTEAFGGIVEKWSSHKDTKELFRQQFSEKIYLEGDDTAIPDCSGNTVPQTNPEPYEANTFKRIICDKKDYYIPSKTFIKNVKTEVKK